MQQHYDALLVHLEELRVLHAENPDVIDDLDDLQAELTDVMIEHKTMLERIKV